MADCNLLDVSCTVTKAAEDGIQSAAADAVRGVNELWNGFMTSWIGDAPSGLVTGSASDWFQYISAPVTGLLLTLGLVAAGAQTAFSARGEPAAEAAKKLGRAVLIMTGGAAFFSVMLVGANSLSKWILTSALGAETGTVFSETTVLAENALLGIVFGLIGVLAVGAQWAIMIFRALALTALVPFWPVAAAAAISGKYDGIFEKLSTWLIAFLIYSPVAAGLYGLAYKLRDGGDGFEGVLYGLGLTVLAVAALPALMRLVMPAVSAVGSSNAFQMALGAVAGMATTAVAAGAVMVSGGAAAPVAAGGRASTGEADAAGAVDSAGGKNAQDGARGAAGVSGAGTHGSDDPVGQPASRGAAAGADGSAPSNGRQTADASAGGGAAGGSVDTHGTLTAVSDVMRAAGAVQDIDSKGIISE